jgi:hypothetical protein
MRKAVKLLALIEEIRAFAIKKRSNEPQKFLSVKEASERFGAWHVYGFPTPIASSRSEASSKSSGASARPFFRA